MRRIREVGTHLITSRYQVDEIMRYAMLLDNYGYDHIKVGDHTLIANPNAPYPNSQALLPAIGARTKRVRLSTSVTDPYRRHPVEIAHWVATLDHITAGRAALGIGAGEMMNLLSYGIEWKKPLTRLREAVEVIKMLWDATPSTPANYSGEFFSLHGGYLQTRPVQKPRPPLYIGAIGKKTRALAGELADGWVPMASETPETLKEQLQDVESGAGKSGRQMDDFEVAVTAYTDVSEDVERTYKSVEGTARTMLVWEREILKRRAGMDIPEDFSVQRMDVRDKELTEKVNSFTASIPRELIEDITIIGTADQCIAKIEKYLDAGATSLMICNLSPEQERVFEVYAKVIFPYLRENYGTEGRR